jgi:Sulfotransferase family
MFSRDPYSKVDFDAPIILIGTGRSGSTLLDAMIESHPDVYSIGETSFLLHRLWEALVERKSYYERTSERLARHAIARGASITWSGFRPRNIANVAKRLARREYLGRAILGWKDMAYTHTPMTPYGDFPKELKEAIADEEVRLRRELVTAFVRLMIPPPFVRPRWMFREIWIGSPSFPYNYDLFLKMFSRAKFVHCIRHPIDYLESMSKIHHETYTDEQMVYHLKAWLVMVERARSLSTSASYFELRYEDLVSDDPSVRSAMFSFLGLSLHKDCLERLDLRFVPGKDSVSYADRASRVIDATPGLRAVMQGLGYADAPYGRLRPDAEIR